jgi:hypothetical protein
MPLDAPLKLGPFSVDSNGRLTPSTPDRFPSFSVTWRGHVVLARLTDAGADDGTLALQAVLGRVPSTGRPDAPGKLPREAAFATLRGLQRTLPRDWKLGLRPDHRIVAETQVTLGLPTSADDLVTQLTLFLLRLAPYLDLLDEGVGVERLQAASIGGGRP